MVKSLLDNFYDADIITQSGGCVVRLARYLLTLKAGDRVIPISEMAKKYKMGVGTIQNSLQKLADANAVKLLSRGHMGTFVESIDKNILWKYCLYGYVRGTMPIPYSNVLVGLATGIYDTFQSDEIMLSMGYVRGSRVRVQNLQAGLSDFTICSDFAAQKAIEEDPGLKIALKFKDDTYMGKPAFLFREGVGLHDGIKMGIDDSSYDQEILTKLACRGVSVKFVKARYNNLFMMLRDKKIDGTVWSTLDLDGRNFTGNIVPIEGHEDEISAAGRAVMLISGNNMEKMTFVKELFDPERIYRIQQDVISGKALPNY